MKLHIQRALAVSAVTLVAFVATSDALAQKPQKEEFTAVTQTLNIGREGIVQITIEDWSPDTDRTALLQTFLGKGQTDIIATDRPMTFGEESRQGQLSDYPFTLIEIHLNTAGVGEGKLSNAAKIQLSKDKQHIELENYGTAPVNLSDVKQKK